MFSQMKEDKARSKHASHELKWARMGLMGLESNDSRIKRGSLAFSVRDV